MSMDFLGIKGKTFLITGVANKKSVATFTAQTLREQGADLVFSVQSQAHLERAQKLFPEAPIYFCDVEDEHSLDAFAREITSHEYSFSGFLHSMAFANYSNDDDSANGAGGGRPRPFIETKTADFLQATTISCFSLVRLAQLLRNSLRPDASVVTVSISDTRATSYGYMGPIKAALDSTVAFLAKSFSEFSRIRVNAVCSGPLKTSASAGIPGYLDNYLYAEKLTLRKQALDTQEVANTIAFLLSPRSSGFNASGVLVDGGLSCNYFDENIVKTVLK